MKAKEEFIALGVLASYLSMFILAALIVALFMSNSFKKMSTSIIAQETLRSNNFHKVDYEEEPGEKVFVENKNYILTPGMTFFLDKGDLQLCATVKASAEAMTINGQEYHVGGQLLDGTIQQTFKYDSKIGKYVNKERNIFISGFNGYQFTIEDKRTGICLPFSGTLTLVQ